MKHEITLGALRDFADRIHCQTFSVKDDTSRGRHEVVLEDINLGDQVLLDNYFHIVVDGGLQDYAFELCDYKEFVRGKLQSMNIHSDVFNCITYSLIWLQDLEEVFSSVLYDRLSSFNPSFRISACTDAVFFMRDLYFKFRSLQEDLREEVHAK